MKLAFSGPRVSGHNEELDTSGGTGTAIVVQAAGKNVSFDGTEGDANTLKDGDNVLHYTAIVKKSSANNAQVTEGAFSAVATGDAANLLITVFCKNGDITNPELSGGKMPDAGRNMTWDLRAPAPTPSHLRATVAIKGSFRGAEF